MQDEWEDVVILDPDMLLNIAQEYVHDVFLAREAGDDYSLLITKALDSLADIEDLFPGKARAFRMCLEMI